MKTIKLTIISLGLLTVSCSKSYTCKTTVEDVDGTVTEYFDYEYSVEGANDYVLVNTWSDSIETSSAVCLLD